MAAFARWLAALLLSSALGAMALWSWLRFPDVEVPARGEWVIPDVTVVNPGADRSAHQTLQIRGNRLVAIRDARDGDEPTPGAEGVAGAFALPGLIELHAIHPRDPAGLGPDKLFHLLLLGQGITTVRDVGGKPGGRDDRRGKQLAELARRVQQGRRAGPRVLTGGPSSDPSAARAEPSRSLHRELRDLVASGVPAEEALARATWGAANGLGAAELGTLVEGAIADLAFFREDPTRDLAALRSLVGVISDGRFYSRERLERDIEAQRAHRESWLYRHVAATPAHF